VFALFRRLSGSFSSSDVVPGRCPIDTGELVRYSDANTPTLVICTRCRHITWERLPTDSELSAYYESPDRSHYHDDQAHLQENNREYYRQHVTDLARRAGKPLKDFSLLDYGSSLPVLVHEAQKLGVIATAVDYTEQARAYAQSKGLLFIFPDKVESQIPDNSLDAIRFSHVLEHLRDPVTTLKLGVSKLKRNGILYITQPNFPVLRARKTDIPLLDAVFPSHLHFFSPLSLKSLLGHVKVEVIGFWTHPNADDVYDTYRKSWDRRLAVRRLFGWAAKGDSSRGVHGNYPFYCGENSELLAGKK
jgi:2-polyprenyl-3-methyl-5-hydroxy-6-metoxy-1,4-benzoquinol methylase